MPTNTAPFVRFAPAVNAARRAIYRYAALAFADPLAGTFPRLADERSQECVEAGCELLRETPAAVTGDLALGELNIERLSPNALLSRLPDEAHELNSQYERTFGLLVTSACPPYETEYIDGKLSFQRAQNLADVAGFYRAFGMELGSYADRPDHIALELEFVALLIDLEVRSRTEAQLHVCRIAQADFVRSHLAWWVPTLARLLQKETPDGFHAAAGQLLCAFLPAERALLGIKPQSAPAQPSPIELPEECEGCVLTSP